MRMSSTHEAEALSISALARSKRRPRPSTMAMAFFPDDWQQTLKAASRITSLPKSWLSTDAFPHKNWPGDCSNVGLPDPDDDPPGLSSLSPPLTDDVSFELPLPPNFAPKFSPCTLLPSMSPSTPKNSRMTRVLSKHPGLSQLFSCSHSPPALPKSPFTSRMQSFTPPPTSFSVSLPDLVPACPASPCTPGSTSARSRPPSTPYTPWLLKPKLEDQVVADIRKRQWGPKRGRKRKAEANPSEASAPSESAALLERPDVPSVARFAETLSELRSFIAGGPPAKKAGSKRPNPALIAAAKSCSVPTSPSALSADRDQSQSFSRSTSPTSVLCGSKSEIAWGQNTAPPGSLLFDKDPSSGFVDRLLISSSNSEAAGSKSCVPSNSVHPSTLEYMNRLLAIPGVTPLTPPHQTATAPTCPPADEVDFAQVDEWEDVLAPYAFSHPPSGDSDNVAICGDDTADWLTSLLSNHDVDSENRLYSLWC